MAATTDKNKEFTIECLHKSRTFTSKTYDQKWKTSSHYLVYRLTTMSYSRFISHGGDKSFLGCIFMRYMTWDDRCLFRNGENRSRRDYVNWSMAGWRVLCRGFKGKVYNPVTTPITTFLWSFASLVFWRKDLCEAKHDCECVRENLSQKIRFDGDGGKSDWPIWG